MINFTGGMLTGAEIDRQIQKGNISITPYDASLINPNSYNLRLHPQLLVYERSAYRANLDPSKYDYSRGVDYDRYQLIEKLRPLGLENAADLLVVDPMKDIFNKPLLESLKLEPIDMNKSNETIEFTIPEEGYVLQPGVLYIGRTIERTASDKFIPMINGRSSGGRLGISIHVCAGFGDIGFDGTWTLEITCVEPVRIYPNVEIAQVCYFKPYGKKGKLYRGRYFKQNDATASRFYKPKEG